MSVYPTSVPVSRALTRMGVTAELLETPISAAEVEAALEIPVAEALAVPD